MCCFTHVNHSNYTNADWKQTTNKQTRKQISWKKWCKLLLKSNFTRIPPRSNVSVLVTSINMQQNLAKLKDLKIQLNVTNSTLCMWSFCPSKRENHHFDLGEHPIYTIHEKPRVAANWKISGLLWTAAG